MAVYLLQQLEVEGLRVMTGGIKQHYNDIQQTNVIGRVAFKFCWNHCPPRM